MRIFLIIVVVIVAIVLIIPAFIDEEVIITRSVEINKPVEQVYDVAKDLNYYRDWNAWAEMDQGSTGEVSGQAGEVGSKYSWKGDTVGTGSLTIEQLVLNQSITSKIEFIEPFAAVAQEMWNFEMVDSNTTHIDYTYSAVSESYFMRYMNPMAEGMVGPPTETGLRNLKELIEAMEPMEADTAMTMEEEM
jgi:hypothetical protein